MLRSTPAVSYVYDAVYPRFASMSDGTGTTSYTYNPVPASGVTTGAARLASMTGPLANSAITYGYDELGRVLSTSINGSANTSSVVYDALSRVTSATNPLGTFGYAYVNQTGRVQSVTYPNGQVTNYGYYPNSSATPGNDDQRLAQIQNLASGGANLSTFGYTYNAVGMIGTWSRQIGAAAALISTFTYDPADQVIAASVPSSSSTVNYSYSYDLAGNRTLEQVDASVTGSTFNNLNQVTAQSPGGLMEFTGTVNEWATITLAGRAATVDASGNWRGTANVTVGANAIPLVATDINANTTTKSINVAVSGGASRMLTYDLNGNLSNDGAGKTYAYDAVNRLITVTQGSNGTTFVYNGLGQRVQEKLNGSVIKQWVWNRATQPAEERDGSNAVTKRFYRLGEQIGGVAYFFTADHLGSVREMTDSTGSIRARYDYDPYGRITKVSGDLEADFGFTGFYRHQASGLSLTLFRAYDPELGRWLNRDPLEDAELNQGPNLYGYARNSPVQYRDTDGRWIWVAVAAGIGAAINAYRHWDEWQNGCISNAQFWGSVATGAATGALSTIAPGFGGGLAAGAVAAFSNSAADQAITTGDVNLGEAAKDTAWGVAGGVAAYGAGKAAASAANRFLWNGTARSGGMFSAGYDGLFNTAKNAGEFTGAATNAAAGLATTDQNKCKCKGKGGK